MDATKYLASIKTIDAGNLDNFVEITGNEQDNIFYIGKANGSYMGGAGDDRFEVNDSFNNQLYGGLGNDEFVINNANNGSFHGEEGNDIITINGGDFNNVSGGDGNDNFNIYDIQPDPNPDIVKAWIYTNKGNDVVNIYNSNNVVVSFSYGNNEFYVDEHSSNINFWFSRDNAGNAGSGVDFFEIRGDEVAINNTDSHASSDGICRTNIIKLISSDSSEFLCGDGEDKIFIIPPLFPFPS